MVIEDRLTGRLKLSADVLDADAEQMLRFQAGDETAFEILVQRYRRPLSGYMDRMLQNSPVSDELTQEAFLRVYLSRRRYRPTARFSTWLYRIATRLALNYLRDHRHERRQLSLDQPSPVTERPPEAASPAPGQEGEMLADERCRRIRRSVAALPERQRTAVILHKYQEMDYRAIGETLQISVNATKSLLFRAYETLRRELRDLEEAR